MALTEHLTAETEEFGGPAARHTSEFSGTFHQTLIFHESSEILLEQVNAGDRLDRSLQFRQCEYRRHQLKHDRPVFLLAAQSCDGGRQDPSVVELHADAQRWLGHLLSEWQPPIPLCLFDKPGFVQQLVALEYALFIPIEALKPETNSRPHSALVRLAAIGSHKALERRDDGPIDECGSFFSPILPWEIAIPIAPERIRRFAFAGRAGQRQVSNRYDAWSLARPKKMATTIPEGVKLLRIFQFELRLLLHP